MTEFDIPDNCGTYALIFRNDATRTVRVGALGRFETRPGFYIYVGSAFGPGGLRARVRRHARRVKKLHWHIDYLRPHAILECAWYGAHTARQEHRWATALHPAFRQKFRYGRFGASDCRCDSHLFFTECRPSLPDFRPAPRFRRSQFDRKRLADTRDDA